MDLDRYTHISNDTFYFDTTELKDDEGALVERKGRDEGSIVSWVALRTQCD